MVAESGTTSKGARRIRRNRRRRDGVVCFLELETMGFDGPATVIIEPGGCASCLEAGGSEHEGCEASPPACAAFAKGLILPRRVDGEWRLELTEEGVAKFQAIESARRGRGR